MLITVNTDGSYMYELKTGGYAFWISSNAGTFKRWGKLKQCNSPEESEFMSLINALHFLRHNEELWGVSKIIINTDCQGMIGIIENAHKRRKKNINKLKGAVGKYLGKWEGKKSTYEFRYVKAHKKIETPREYVNDWLDKHAKKGARL